MINIDHEALKIEFSERSRPIVFWTGAGLSAPVIPSWAGLRDHLLVYLKEHAKLLNSVDQRAQLQMHARIKGIEDLWLAFDLLEKAIGREAYVQRIKECLSPSEKVALPQAHTRLWELAPTGVVTLNLDLFTQRGASAHPKNAIPIQIHPGKFTEHLNVLRERRPFIAYPHGHLDNPTLWTFTKSELDRRLADSQYIEWLNVLFRASTVVFVGVTADDIAIGSPIERIVSNRIPLSGHFWLTARDDVAADKWAGCHGTRVIRYDNNTGDHSELLHILHGLRSPIRQEDPVKESPVFPRSALPVITELPDPNTLATEPDEKKRQLLNARAKQILQNPDESARDGEYADFLQRYGRSVYGAWYASTVPGENEFLGYHLMSEVDGGAFGTVFKATDSEGSMVAIKILKSENFRKPGFHRSFRRGANSLRIITERGIDGVIEFIDAAEIPPSIVMSWSDGRSLVQLVESGQVSDWEERIAIALQLASILKICHGLPERVFHRDLRPANVMIENSFDGLGEWKVVVLDFDLSWHKGAEDHSIMHSPAFGYLAPEQRQKGRFTTRNALVDSYGFGMSIYYLCTGKNPFPDQHLHVNWIPDLFRQLESKKCSTWVSLPRRVARLVQNVTQHEQSARATMSQIEGELESLQSALSTAAKIQIVDVIAEELAARTEHFRGYSWSDADSQACITSASGLSLGLQALPGKRIIQFTATWSSSGTQDWSHIDRMLSHALPKITTTLQKIAGHVDTDKGRRAFSVTAQIDADRVRSNPVEVARELDRAVEHATAIANF